MLGGMLCLTITVCLLICIPVWSCILSGDSVFTAVGLSSSCYVPHSSCIPKCLTSIPSLSYPLGSSAPSQCPEKLQPQQLS